MDQPLTVSQADELEHLIDRHGIENVLRTISMICGEKSQHVNEAWQDKTLARAWSQLASRLDAIATSTHGM